MCSSLIVYLCLCQIHIFHVVNYMYPFHLIFYNIFRNLCIIIATFLLLSWTLSLVELLLVFMFTVKQLAHLISDNEILVLCGIGSEPISIKGIMYIFALVGRICIFMICYWPSYCCDYSLHNRICCAAECIPFILAHNASLCIHLHARRHRQRTINCIMKNVHGKTYIEGTV